MYQVFILQQDKVLLFDSRLYLYSIYSDNLLTHMHHHLDNF